MRALLLATAACLLAMPMARAENLRIAMKAAVDSSDPHLTFTPNRNVQLHVYETLLTQDDRLIARPQLADSWRSLDPLTWEFKLRPGVRFHDGSPLTAADVAFSIRRAQNAPGARTYAAAVRNVTEMTVVDDLTLIVKTQVPTPLQPHFLVGIAILSERAATDATEADFNGGRAAIGTGPYRWIKWTPQQNVVIERSDTWRGAREPWDRVTFSFISNDSARVAALLSDDVDVIDSVPSGLHARIRASDATQLISGDSIFTYYFYLDSMSAQIPNATDAEGQILPQNPLRDLRVRQAMTHAINRVALAERAMEGGASPAGQIAAAGFSGHDPSIPVPSYDPALSRRLLAEAGYPQGFNLTIHCTLDRFAGDARSCQAIAQMLTVAGIKTTIEALPMPVYLRRSANRLPDGVPELSAHLAMFGSSSGLASEAMTALVRTPNAGSAQGGWNRTRYSNPELDRLLSVADATFDDAAREVATQRAVRFVVENDALLPVFFMRASWGVRKPLRLTPRGDQYTMATDIRAAP
ncbi:peptide/nickel transport system substrate-binding protein [Humitalea rosea]|uniref:Peptide/nickel transport system substrate-binding protein n=1 Tax=Humitalea rosea TaxID=990373 RepID=A0A2W7JFT9_9PROT|nr:ABC transporter substrate-binding protein [Humitalea rosea]PZW50923.1 peptide/nickel transport system substrate-binding protein [Humitalea rosea]